MQDIKPLTRMTFETLGSTYVVEHTEDCMNINELIDTTIRPLLLAAGFHHKTLDQVFGKPG